MGESPWEHLVMTLVTVAGMAALMWMEAPEWQREIIKRAARNRLRRLAAGVARRSGHRAMGDELDGRTEQARAGYGFTYRLSTFRDRL